RVDGLGIREVARDAVARGYAELRLTTELDAVTAADLARQRHDLAHPRSDEGLRHCGVVIALLAVILQLRDAHAHGRRRRHGRQRIGELLLHELERGDGPAELLTRAGVGHRALIGADGDAERLPGDLRTCEP